ncbi:hypothetical protein [Escherichia coli]|uniref:hypothetical protein n=1 Tax=Escherichia coli TaxID=562 RepID=UPI003F66F9CB
MMSGDAEMTGTPLRALLYALFEISKEVEVDDVLLHLMENCPNYLPNKQLLAKMADYLAEKREGLKGTKTFTPEQEASSARVLAEAIRNQRLCNNLFVSEVVVQFSAITADHPHLSRHNNSF